jgi:hypothetical protein
MALPLSPCVCARDVTVYAISQRSPVYALIL